MYSIISVRVTPCLNTRTWAHSRFWNYHILCSSPAGSTFTCADLKYESQMLCQPCSASLEVSVLPADTLVFSEGIWGVRENVVIFVRSSNSPIFCHTVALLPLAPAGAAYARTQSLSEHFKFAYFFGRFIRCPLSIVSSSQFSLTPKMFANPGFRSIWDRLDNRIRISRLIRRFCAAHHLADYFVVGNRMEIYAVRDLM